MNAALRWLGAKMPTSNADRNCIVCHAHGALFDIATGAVLLGPAWGQSLTAMPITLRADGVITVRLNSSANRHDANSWQQACWFIPKRQTTSR